VACWGVLERKKHARKKPRAESRVLSNASKKGGLGKPSRAGRTVEKFDAPVQGKPPHASQCLIAARRRGKIKSSGGQGHEGAYIDTPVIGKSANSSDHRGSRSWSRVREERNERRDQHKNGVKRGKNREGRRLEKKKAGSGKPSR